MAAFTSIASGNYNDGPTTWGTAAGVFPGSTASQADTITVSAGHTVALNVTTLAGTVGNVTIAATGVFEVAANFAAYQKFTTGDWAVNGTLRWKNDAAGTYCLALVQAVVLTIKSGGKLEMVSESDPDIKHRLYLSAGSISNTTYAITESGATVDIRGYAAKTQKTITTVQPVIGATSVTVDDATGWAIGDLIILQYGRSSIVKTITGGSGLTWSWSGALAADMPEVISVYNMTKNVDLWNNNLARNCRLQIAAGTTATIKNCSCIGFLLSQIIAEGIYERITSYANAGYSFYLYGNNIKLKDSIGYIYANSNTNFYIFGENCILDGVDAITPGTSTVAVRILKSCIMKNFVVVGNSGISASSSGRLFFNNGKVFDCITNGILSANYEYYYAGNIDFGYDEHGNALQNANDLALGYAWGNFDNCKFSASSVEVATPSSDGNMVVLTNYDQTEGFRKELQRYGIIYSDAAEARSGYCLACDPSSTTNSMKLLFSFPCAASKNPQVKFWAKKSGTLGNVGIMLPSNSAGIIEVTDNSGSVDADGYITPTDSWAQYTINLTGNSTIYGEVEVAIYMFDSDSGILYIDDITISGNL